MRFGLEGRTALITGASSGLGAHFAQVLAGAGARVALAARRIERLEALRDEIRAGGGEAVAIALDVAEDGAGERAVAECTEALGPLDILVNNAGIARMDAPLDMAIGQFDRVIAINLRGVFAMAQAAGRVMRDARGGSIVNIASILGIRPAGGLTAYCAAKAGVIQMTRSMALELARFDIRVNAIAPGYFATEINRDWVKSEAAAKSIARVPQRRIGELHELDGPLLLLASDAGAYMTGAVIPVDGGHLVSTL